MGKFTDDGVREHLQCVLDSISRNSTVTSVENAQREKREQLHNKMAAASSRRQRGEIPKGVGKFLMLSSRNKPDTDNWCDLMFFAVNIPHLS